MIPRSRRTALKNRRHHCVAAADAATDRPALSGWWDAYSEGEAKKAAARVWGISPDEVKVVEVV